MQPASGQITNGPRAQKKGMSDTQLPFQGLGMQPASGQITNGPHAHTKGLSDTQLPDA